MLHSKIPSTSDLLLILVIYSYATDLVVSPWNTDSANPFVCRNLRINNRIDRLFNRVLFSPKCFHLTDKRAFILPKYVGAFVMENLIHIYLGWILLPEEILKVWTFSWVDFLVKCAQDIGDCFVDDPVHVFANLVSL